jgi:uncharacterized cupin superfamily protein
VDRRPTSITQEQQAYFLPGHLEVVAGDGEKRLISAGEFGEWRTQHAKGMGQLFLGINM